ncbi:N-(5'-phosphoribosyl)anthranilate isomerase [Marinobacterium nitratireducens]|uniref:N-(5'-phosphoribosyl)anthranilate isomerase n=1 Tax=Marinobacterium nitratireducens TaxID=518897 RepID=A0A917Z7D1_9GAMM|nr:phosphoribosylanthranilate isomerase [Marinobacterium nitratireducens]GGO76053.1 N-(5'-phosphoribosyl)anthranilate isomerase [Marinobacterium nitratireducens]
MTRIKICGITTLEDALAAVEYGAHALGFVFYEPSPRYVEPEVAARIIAALPPFVTTTALFVDAPAARIESVLATTGVDLLQFHGDEPESGCRSYNRPYIKALRMKSGLDLAAAVAEYPSARGILLDAYRPGVPGGTGESFDWSRIPVDLAPRIVLAGGLTPDNIADGVRQVRPFAVDVSGGVERAKGVKDHNKLKQFIEEVARADKS